jgi:DNA-binding MarR family transcriptional regulator
LPDWTIISTHGLVLAYIAKYPRSTAREIASAIKVTEWTIHRIIAELEKEGYIKRQKMGRKNVYHINPHTSLRHETVRHIKVKDLLKTLD